MDRQQAEALIRRADGCRPPFAPGAVPVYHPVKQWDDSMQDKMAGAPLMTNPRLVIGRVGVHRQHPGRLCLMRPDGVPMTVYGIGMTITDVVVALSRRGRLLCDDNTVVQTDAPPRV